MRGQGPVKRATVGPKREALIAAASASFSAPQVLASLERFADSQGEYEGELAALGSRVLRDLFGSPFRPASLDSSWLTRKGGAAAGLARSIYDDAHFDDLAVLADTLETAGCTHREM